MGKQNTPKNSPDGRRSWCTWHGPWSEALVPTPDIHNASIAIMVENGAVATAVTANQAPVVNGGGAAQAPATANHQHDAASSQAHVVNDGGAAAQAPATRANVPQAAAPKEKQWPYVYNFRGQNIQLLSGVERKPLPSGNEHWVTLFNSVKTVRD